MTTIDEEQAKASTAKATAESDRLMVYQYLTDNLGIDADKNFVYARFADGSPASKQECARRLFRLLARSKRASRQAVYCYVQKQLKSDVKISLLIAVALTRKKKNKLYCLFGWLR